MKRVVIPIVALVFVLVCVSTGFAQLNAAKEGPVVYGHHHLNVTNVDEQMKFWVDTLGGATASFGSGQLVRFPNVHILLSERTPTGGTKGTTVNHIGFWVPSVSDALAAVRAAGYPIVTREELPPALEVKDDMAYIANQDTYVAFVMAPDDIKVELVENRTQTDPVALHHIHFSTHDVDAMKTWYVRTFNAEGGMRGSFEAADLPGVNLTFSNAAEAPEGTQGRSLDHIGFEIDGLEAFCRRLEGMGVTFDRPYREIEGLGIAIAFFTDPFGTYIELTEGLDNY